MAQTEKESICAMTASLLGFEGFIKKNRSTRRTRKALAVSQETLN